MTASEFREKRRITHEISKVFCKQMNCKKMKQIIDAVFDNRGLFKDKYTYSFYEYVSGDFCGVNQGTMKELRTRVECFLDERKYILFKTEVEENDR